MDFEEGRSVDILEDCLTANLRADAWPPSWRPGRDASGSRFNNFFGPPSHPCLDDGGSFTVEVAVITGSHGEGRHSLIPLLYINQILHTDAVFGAQNLS